MSYSSLYKSKLKELEKLTVVKLNEYTKALKAFENALNLDTKMRLFPDKYLYHPINTLNNKTKAELINKFHNKHIPSNIIGKIMGAETSYSRKPTTKHNRKIYYDKIQNQLTLQEKKQLFRNAASKGAARMR